jgi:undecaprenyl-diphosphatase
MKTFETLLKSIILGIVQGLTEWLPISSTGHLRLVEFLLGLKTPILFDVVLHVGTLIVVLVFFRKEISKIILAIAHLDFKSEYGKTVPLIIVGVIPTLLIGIIYGRLIEDTFQSILPIAIAFIVSGFIIYSSRIGEQKKNSIGYSTAIIMGVCQGVAIIPGISRSGTTIAIALLLGIKREKAFRFSFLLSIPAILGALSLTIFTELSELTAIGIGWSEILAGFVMAMFVGYFTLKMLLKITVKGKFYLFSWYSWLLGVALILLLSFL